MQVILPITYRGKKSNSIALLIKECRECVVNTPPCQRGGKLSCQGLKLYFGERVGMIWSFETLSVKLFVLSIPQFLLTVFYLMREVYPPGVLCWILIRWLPEAVSKKTLWLCICCHWLHDGSPKKSQPKPCPGAALESTFLPVRQKPGVFPRWEDLYPETGKQTKQQPSFPSENTLTIPDKRAKLDKHYMCFS